jgi:hypothetical protein
MTLKAVVAKNADDPVPAPATRAAAVPEAGYVDPMVRVPEHQEQAGSAISNEVGSA